MCSLLDDSGMFYIVCVMYDVHISEGFAYMGEMELSGNKKFEN